MWMEREDQENKYVGEVDGGKKRDNKGSFKESVVPRQKK